MFKHQKQTLLSNQNPEVPETFVNPLKDVNVIKNFDLFDTKKLRFIGAGAFGAVFLVPLRPNNVDVVFKIQFFDKPNDIYDINSIPYTELKIHHEITKNLVDNCTTPSFTKLLAQFRCKFPFETEFFKAIQEELDRERSKPNCIYRSNIEAFLITLAKRFRFHQAIVKRNPKVISQLFPSSVNISPSNFWYTIETQFVVSEYGGENIFSLFHRNTLSNYLESGFSEDDNRFLLAFLFQLFFALHVAVNRTGFIHLDLSLSNILYGNVNSEITNPELESASTYTSSIDYTTKGTRYVLENGSRWFIPWSCIHNPIDKVNKDSSRSASSSDSNSNSITTTDSQHNVIRMIDFGNSLILKPENINSTKNVLKRFEDGLNWKPMKHIVSYSLRRFLETFFEKLPGNRVPFVSLIQEDMQDLINNFNVPVNIAEHACNIINTEFPAFVCTPEVWKKHYEKRFMAPLLKILIRNVNSSRERNRLNQACMEWARCRMIDGQWAIRKSTIDSLRNVLPNQSENVIKIISAMMYQLFPPGSYHNILLEQHNLKIKTFRNSICKTKLLNLTKNELSNIMEWLKDHIIVGKWENQGNMYKIPSDVRYVLSFIHKKYSMDETYYHSTAGTTTIQEQLEYASVTYREILNLEPFRKHFMVKNSIHENDIKLDFEQLKTDPSYEYHGPIYGLSLLPSNILSIIQDQKNLKILQKYSNALYKFSPTSLHADISYSQLPQKKKILLKSAVDAVRSKDRKETARIIKISNDKSIIRKPHSMKKRKKYIGASKKNKKYCNNVLNPFNIPLE